MNAFNCNQKKKIDVDTDAKQSSRNDDHWAQNKYTRRFQRFVEDWAFPDNHEAEEYDMTSVTIPISLFVAEKDSLCTLEWAEWLAGEVSSLQNFYVIENVEHRWPLTHESVQFMELLLNEVYSDTLLELPNKQNF